MYLVRTKFGALMTIPTFRFYGFWWASYCSEHTGRRAVQSCTSIYVGWPGVVQWLATRLARPAGNCRACLATEG